ncbi:MAG: hypothetical protein AAB502_04195 [Chloroflexota bacterium]
MPRRKTVIGRGAFGSYIPQEEHAWEVLKRILSRGHPLTEDALFLCMWNILRCNNSLILKCVRQSSDVGGYQNFSFSPDIDLLEVRPNGAVIGYELKGHRRGTSGIEPPTYYEGVDQALAYLVNPTASPISKSFAGSIFDQVYLVHPEGTQVEKLASLVERCTPLGIIVVGRTGTKELVKPKPNPYLDNDLKKYFLSRLGAFEKYKTWRVNPIQ